MGNDDKDRVYEGTVIWFSRLNYGFISWEKDGFVQNDIFAHWSDIVSEGYKSLKKDQKVQFKLGINVRGQPKAIEITAV